MTKKCLEGMIKGMKSTLIKTSAAMLSLGILSNVNVTDTAYASSKDDQLFHYPEGKIVNVAHRGASGHAPEHTMFSYELGEKLNGDYIEIDLQMTADDTLIAMHDETVDRTTDGSGSVEGMTLEEIKQLDAGAWFNAENPDKARDEYVGIEVPTLEEVFQNFGTDAYYYIETKSPDINPGMEEELLRLIDEYDVGNEVIIQSFSSDSLELIHSKDSSIPLVQLLGQPELGEGTHEELEEIKEYAIGVGPSFNNINGSYVQTVREYGLHIHPYTVNNKDDMRTAIEWGVTGLFTDFPDRFHEVITEFQSASYIKELVERFDEEGLFEDDEVVHALNMHLTAVNHYENQEEADKVVQHMGGFHDLLDHQRDNELISDNAYDSLKASADNLIQKWG